MSNADVARSFANYFGWDFKSEQVHEITAALDKRDEEHAAEVKRLRQALIDVNADCIWFWEYLDDLDYKHANQCVTDIQTQIRAALSNSADHEGV